MLPRAWANAISAADIAEHKRLDIQHEMLREKLNGLYPRQISNEVRKLLSRQRGDDQPPPAVLDVGTGSGSWAIDIARLFTNAEVTGMDLVPSNTFSYAIFANIPSRYVLTLVSKY